MFKKKKKTEIASGDTFGVGDRKEREVERNRGRKEMKIV